MIASVRGELLESHGSTLVVEVGGLGYEIQVTPGTAAGFRTGEEVFIHVHHHIREDAAGPLRLPVL